MKKMQICFFLSVMAFSLIPWQGFNFCTQHPLGHHNHKNHGQCAKRNQYKGVAYWPPMECFKVIIITDSYFGEEDLDILPNKSITSFRPEAVFCFVPINSNCSRIGLYDFGSNSDPPLQAYHSRGPPSI